eukprot:1182189-Prorocentrum_minimum.AAC.2
MLPQEAQKELSKYSLLVLVDTPRPVAMFGYRGGPASELLSSWVDEQVWEIDTSFDIPGETMGPGGGYIPGICPLPSPDWSTTAAARDSALRKSSRWCSLASLLPAVREIYIRAPRNFKRDIEW